MDHVGARRIIIAAFKQKMGRDPSLAEAQLAQAVGAIESSYGTYSSGEEFSGAEQSSDPPSKIL